MKRIALVPLVVLLAVTCADVDPERIDLGCFRPKGIAGMLVAGPAGDVSMSQAQRLTRPLELLVLGCRLGVEAVRMAKSRTLGTVKPLVRVLKGKVVEGCDVAEDLKGHRPHHEYPRLRTEADSVPGWGEYDVLVVGGGPAGCPAAAEAAARGAKVLVVEMLGVVGGTQVNGIGNSKGNLSQLRFNQLTEAGCEGFPEDGVNVFVVAPPVVQNSAKWL